MPTKAIVAAIGAVALLIIGYMTMGINTNGYRTVVQRPSGYTFVKFTPGPYLHWFGSAESYPDIITFDFDKSQDGGDVRSIEQQGIAVRYQDGGTGVIYGQGRYNLPNDEPTMVSLHRAFRSATGLGHKLIKPTAEERINLTAGLMTSEEAYTTKRGVFTEWARDQIQKGKYKTTLQKMQAKEEGTQETVYRDFPVIEYGKDGQPIYLDNDFTIYGITLSGFQIVDWNFEDKTLEQIAAKRGATMAIITAKANAERAKQDAETAKQEGIAKVAVAQYEKEVEKKKAEVDAEKDKAVAVTKAEQLKVVAETNAKQRVAVAEQDKLEKEQNKLAMAEYKQAETLRGEGDASYKKAVIEADGALAQKLQTYENVMAIFAKEFGRQKWVPEIVFGANATPGGSGNQAADLINLLNAKTAKDLSLDLGVAGPRNTAQK